MRCPGRISTSKLQGAVLLLILAICPGCLGFGWNRSTRYSPPDFEALAALEPGTHQLGDCLEQLGAPIWAWEVSSEQNALAWGWLDVEDLGFRVSVPLSRASVSFTFNNLDQRMQGLVLWFDKDWNLVATQRGLLRDLNVASEPVRPVRIDGSR